MTHERATEGAPARFHSRAFRRPDREKLDFHRAPACDGPRKREISARLSSSSATAIHCEKRLPHVTRAGPRRGRRFSRRDDESFATAAENGRVAGRIRAERWCNDGGLYTPERGNGAHSHTRTHAHTLGVRRELGPLRRARRGWRCKPQGQWREQKQPPTPSPKRTHLQYLRTRNARSVILADVLGRARRTRSLVRRRGPHSVRQRNSHWPLERRPTSTPTRALSESQWPIEAESSTQHGRGFTMAAAAAWLGLALAAALCVCALAPSSFASHRRAQFVWCGPSAGLLAGEEASARAL